MEPPDSDPIEEATKAIQAQWADQTDAFARVFRTILRCSEYQHYPVVAEEADCAENTAKKHLERLVNMGIVDRNDNIDLATYRRSRPYIEWWITQDLASRYSMEKIISRIEELERYQHELEIQFDEIDLSPNEIYLAESISMVSEQLDAVTKWRYAELQIRYHQFAYQISRFDGHFMSRLKTNTLPQVENRESK